VQNIDRHDHAQTPDDAKQRNSSSTESTIKKSLKGSGGEQSSVTYAGEGPGTATHGKRTT